MKTALYRHFDAAGRLLYVGISNAHIRRLDQHRAHKAWADEIARIEVEYFASRELAFKAEAAAIATEKPAHNEKVRAPRSALRRNDDPVWGVVHSPSGRIAGWFDDQEEAEALFDRWSGIYELGGDFRFIAPQRDEASPIEGDECLSEGWLDANYGKVVHVVGRRIDWFQVVADLRRVAGMTEVAIADALGVNRASIRSAREWHEPRFEVGEALLDLWSVHTHTPVERAPRVTQASLSAAQMR